jgi:hypothetical protein
MRALIVVLLSLVGSVSALPAYALDESPNAALAIASAARRQAEAASTVVTDAGGAQGLADKVFEDAFSQAIREGVRLANPDATAEQRLRLVHLIHGAISAEAVVMADSIDHHGKITEFDQFEANQAYEGTFRFAHAREKARLEKTVR